MNIQVPILLAIRKEAATRVAKRQWRAGTWEIASSQRMTAVQ